MFSRIIKITLGLAIIVLIQYLCNLFVRFTNIILPSPILGLIVFALLMHFNIIKKDWVKDACTLLLKYMPLMFVPVFTGIIAYYSIIEKHLIPILINITVTATLTLIITAIIVENIIKSVRLNKLRNAKHD